MEDLIKLAIISIIITIANIYIYIYTEHRRIKTILVFPFTDEQDVQTGRTALIFFFFLRECKKENRKLNIQRIN